jgi:outer membrane protein
MRRYLIVLVGVLTFSAARAKPPVSGSVKPLSLEEALRYAEKNQNKIKNALLDQQSSLAKSKEITGLAYPQIKGKGGINYSPLVAAFEVPNFIKTAIVGDSAAGIPGLVQKKYLDSLAVVNYPNTIPLAFQPKWSSTATLEASQILFDPSVMVALQARQALKELSEKSVALTVQDVKVAVTKSYYNILIAEKQRALVDQNVIRMQQMEHETREIYKAGLAEKIDVDRVTVIVNNLQTQRIRLQQMVSLAYLSLKFQMGMPLEEQIALTDSLTDDYLGNDLLEAQLNYQARGEFQLLEVQNRFLSYDVKRYKLAWLPTLALFGNYGYTLYNADRLFDPKDSWQKSALIGASLNVPIFDGFQRKQKLRQAEIAVEKNENDIEQLKNALTLEKENARIMLGNNVLALQNQKANMKLAEEVYNTARVKYKEGVGSSLEVINAESSLKEAQTNYFSALYDVITARVDLQKALGQLQ